MIFKLKFYISVAVKPTSDVAPLEGATLELVVDLWNSKLKPNGYENYIKVVLSF